MYFDLTEQVRQDVLAGRLKFLYHTEHPMDGALKSAVDLMSQEENRTVLQGDPANSVPGRHQWGLYWQQQGRQWLRRVANATPPTTRRTTCSAISGTISGHLAWAKHLIPPEKRLRQRCYGCTLESQKNYLVLVSFKQLVRKPPA
ncbi:MAG: hypothetical protein R2857_09760 [Vampirovibrionales bacterium]